MRKKLLQAAFVILTLFTFVSCNTGKASSNVVYQDKGFSISETRIGDAESIQWTKLPIPDDRIQDSTPSLDVDGDQLPIPSPNAGDFPFSLTISVPVNDNSANIFELKSQYFIGNGKAVLEKNGEIIWEGFMDGGTGLPVQSFLNFNGEIIFGYTDYSRPAQNQAMEYVVYSAGDKTVVIKSAFVPSVIMGEAIYFQRVDNQVFVARNGRRIGEPYDSILQACCGYEAKYGVLHNEKVVDFFAVRNQDWYHVQVGFKP
ncbi:MAG: hypothetical protein JNM55_09295 [Anaerolineales bacterium]|nr:hypothetical protein [Anaerolineales bacterium]